jgi:hypothetical protein
MSAATILALQFRETLCHNFTPREPSLENLVCFEDVHNEKLITKLVFNFLSGLFDSVFGFPSYVNAWLISNDRIPRYYRKVPDWSVDNLRLETVRWTNLNRCDETKTQFRL